MFQLTAQCSVCKKEIQPYEEIYLKMRYPKSRGMTEIKAYIQNEGKIICKTCFDKKR
ncbi:hypothetical protein JOC94_004013 [Bacillus thermophilus]|uniref:Fe3+ hydroxamate ABC transporter substrate-binding protein n=1 Tax=Siminovitchia thermophila TaxID=1245522 RepID=A0ABS2RCR3_9BACI|nr:hypothetical protein [Siminovitchia thermophila]